MKTDEQRQAAEAASEDAATDFFGLRSGPGQVARALRFIRGEGSESYRLAYRAAWWALEGLEAGR